MTEDQFHHLVREAAQAPSVHNTQPARWRREGGDVVLLEDTSRRLPAGDPTGRDAGISLGAALEGFCLAASSLGLGVEMRRLPSDDTPLRPVARLRLTPGATPDPLAAAVATRRSWRGAFAATNSIDQAAATGLEAADSTVVTAPLQIARLAELSDQASLGFMRDGAFRRELLSWMRLSKRHPRWGQDGLNAEAMALGWVETLGAGVLMGVGFRGVDAVGLAAPLLSESAKTRSATALLLFHRPEGEDPVETGRAFYRTWLRIEAAGFGAAVMAALADDPEAAKAAALVAKLPEGQRLISAFRLGRRPGYAPVPRARRPLEELLA